MNMQPKTAVFLAAGSIQRLTPISDLSPTPLIRIEGRSIFKRAVDRMREEGVEKFIVVLNKTTEKIQQRMSSYEYDIDITYIFEEEPKGSLCALKQALPHIGTDPFWVVHTDILWLYSWESSLSRLYRLWRPKKMDVMMLMFETAESWGNVSRGDHYMAADGRIIPCPERQASPWVFTGIQLIKPEYIAQTTADLDMREMWKNLVEEERIYGALHDGEWFHIDDRHSLNDAQTYMTTHYAYTPRRF